GGPAPGGARRYGAADGAGDEHGDVAGFAGPGGRAQRRDVDVHGARVPGDAGVLLGLAAGLGGGGVVRARQQQQRVAGAAAAAAAAAGVAGRAGRDGGDAGDGRHLRDADRGGGDGAVALPLGGGAAAGDGTDRVPVGGRHDDPASV